MLGSLDPLWTLAAGIVTALITSGCIYLGERARKAATIKTAEAAAASGLEAVRQQALIDVYKLAKDQRDELQASVKEAKAEVSRERDLRAKLGERIGGLEVEMANLRGAHELLLRLQCPLATSGECPVFRSDRPRN